jgi:hypothetical protein
VHSCIAGFDDRGRHQAAGPPSGQAGVDAGRYGYDPAGAWGAPGGIASQGPPHQPEGGRAGHYAPEVCDPDTRDSGQGTLHSGFPGILQILLPK